MWILSIFATIVLVGWSPDDNLAMPQGDSAQSAAVVAVTLPASVRQLAQGGLCLVVDPELAQWVVHSAATRGVDEPALESLRLLVSHYFLTLSEFSERVDQSVSNRQISNISTEIEQATTGLLESIRSVLTESATTTVQLPHLLHHYATARSAGGVHLGNALGEYVDPLEILSGLLATPEWRAAMRNEQGATAVAHIVELCRHHHRQDMASAAKARAELRSALSTDQLALDKDNRRGRTAQMRSAMLITLGMTVDGLMADTNFIMLGVDFRLELAYAQLGKYVPPSRVIARSAAHSVEGQCTSLWSFREAASACEALIRELTTRRRELEQEPATDQLPKAGRGLKRAWTRVLESHGHHAPGGSVLLERADCPWTQFFDWTSD
ncbi:MAG: hypothetical protein KF724_08815 [Phycisphaeraceae bacterium]|nr:hypothetical protein [Phycisphaeraceae bacterium]